MIMNIKKHGAVINKAPLIFCTLLLSFPVSAQMDSREAIDYLMRGFERIERPMNDAGLATQGNGYLVQPGDTLDVIIDRTLGRLPVKRSLLRQAFVKANPSAFRRGDPNYIFAGKRLRIPDVEDLGGVIFTDPNQMAAPRDKSHWIRYPY